MARRIRIQFEGAWYHVMNRGVDHQKIFFNKYHREFFLELLDQINKIYGIEIHAYCLMGNHYHLILHTPRANLNAAMQYLNSRYAQKLNQTISRDGPLFRGRYNAIVVGAEDYLLRLSRYIHRNPAGIIKENSLQTYQWSSYPYYIRKYSSPSWLITKEIINRFGKNNFRARYANYVENTSDLELDEFYNSSKFQPVLGTDEYREYIFEQLKSRSLSAEIVGANNIIIPPSLDTILKKVAEYFHIKVHEISTLKYKSRNSARETAIFLCRNIGGCKLNDIAKVMNISYQAVSNILHRTKIDENIKKISLDLNQK